MMIDIYIYLLGFRFYLLFPAGWFFILVCRIYGCNYITDQTSLDSWIDSSILIKTHIIPNLYY